MKRLSIAILLLCWLLLVGLAIVRTTPSPSPALADSTVTPLIPGPFPTARIPNELTYYTKRCWPACHYMPAWLSEEPDRLTEEFEGSFGSDWVWLNEDDALWSLEESPGALRIAAPGGSFISEGADLEDVTNVLAHAAPPDHFDVQTKVTFDPGQDLQNAGVFVQLHDGAVISLGRGYCEPGADRACVGDGVYFDAVGVDCDYRGAPVSADTVCLMLRRAGNSYVGYYHLSEPGETEMPVHMGWTEVGRCFLPGATPMSVGLSVGNGSPGAGEVSADFDIATLVERK
ncbi:MAG: hypothetical protein PVH41_10495 [Anaerolineae bacterium]|jgi:hypothetical protein